MVRTTLALFAALVLAGAVSVTAHSQERLAAGATSGERAVPDAESVKRAVERCSANRGIDCSSPDVVKEWLLLDRSREEAVNDGARHLSPAGPRR